MEDTLHELKTHLEEANNKLNRLKGKKETLMEQLKSLGYKNIKAGQSALETLDEELTVLEENLENSIQKFKDEYSRFFEGDE